MPKKKRLTSEHPTSKKLEKVFALLTELNLSIGFGRYGDVFIYDEDVSSEDGHVFEFKDAEGGPAENRLPPTFEYKLVYDNYDEERAQELIES
jgi:hypothetical protein